MTTPAGAPCTVLDETGFDVRGHSADAIESSWGRLADVVDEARAVGLHVHRYEETLYTEVDHGVELLEYLYDRRGEVDPDVRRRMAVLLDKMPAWVEPDGEDLCVPVEIAGRRMEFAPSTALAAAQVRGGAHVACVSAAEVGTSVEAGHVVDVQVQVQGRPVVDVPYLRTPHGARVHLRSVACHRQVDEPTFWKWAPHMFPDLDFGQGLKFARFTGDYRDVLPVVVKLLGKLNDDFVQVYRDCRGEADAVHRALQVEVSPESPRTRASEKLMRHRDVLHAGTVLRCEWHLKIRGDRDRIHFSVPSPEAGNRVFVGIFTSHLPT